MLNFNFLNQIRKYELEKIIKHFPPNASILEIGAGTGYQAEKLSKYGFIVTAIDLPNSSYKTRREFPVVEYDGVTLPFEDNKFDIVFSSHTLEHIVNLDAIHKESKRVLRSDGFCLHVLPSGSWRFWTNLTHYIKLLQVIFFSLFRKFLKQELESDLNDLLRKGIEKKKSCFFPKRHGERYNAVVEIFTFSKYNWVQHFKKYNMFVEKVEPIGLFYTGYMVFPEIPLTFRTKLAKVFGSSSIIYKIAIDKS